MPPSRRFICTVELRGGATSRRVVTAPTEGDVRRRLEGSGECFLLEVQELGARKRRNPLAGRVSLDELVVFFRQWQILQRAGIPLAQAVRGSLRRRSSTLLSRVMEAAVSEIEGGKSVSEAVAPYPELFPPHFVAALSVAERTGDIPDAIGRHIDHLTRLRELKRTVTGAATYPAFLLASMVAVSLFLLLYVLPSFSRLYEDSRVELPWITTAFLGASVRLRAIWPWILLAAAAAAATLRILWLSPPIRIGMERILYRLPVGGAVATGQAVVRFSRTLSTLLKGGFPLLDSVRLSIEGLPGLLLKEKIGEVAFSVEGGESFGSAMRRADSFPEVAVQLIEAGERGGNLPEMLDQAAEYAEEELRHRVRLATSLLEPVLMVLVGLLVALVVVAIYLPIFRLGALGG